MSLAPAPRRTRAPAFSRPQAIHLLAERRPARRTDLALLILTDGNRRWARDEGYAAGGRRVVAIAEHLATRPEVSRMIAVILSPENIAKRSDGFFLELHRAFLRLGLAIATEGALVSSGIRLEAAGDLGMLRRRGGPAGELADAIEAAIALTAGVDRPRLTLFLAVGYGSELARELDVDILLRTGMEEEGALRLSGLHASPAMAAFSTTRLWPEIESEDIDRVIDAALQRTEAAFAPGHDPAQITALIAALARADFPVGEGPLRISLATHAPERDVQASLDALFAAAPIALQTITVNHVVAADAEPRRHGSVAGARLEIGIVPASPMEADRAGASFDTLIAPGQSGAFLVLPDWPPSGHATIHPCEAGTGAIVAAIQAAIRFSSEHPPLLGADRAPADLPGASEEFSPRSATHASDRDAQADRFAARSMTWAAQAELWPDGEPIQRAFYNYALTAFFIHHRATAEAHADLSARYMLIVAAGDEGIFDGTTPGETRAQRLDRVRRAARHLCSSILEETPGAPAPEMPGRPLIEAIARAWAELLAEWRPHAHPALFEAFRHHLGRLYSASVAEIDGSWIEQPTEAPSPSEAEHLVQRYLREAAASVGAGLLYRAVALAAPRESVNAERIASLDTVATLLDQHFRLANDLAGFLASPGGDRDDKPTTCSILVPRDATGRARSAAIVQAAAIVRRLSIRTGEELERAVEQLGRGWPAMAIVLRRGIFVGRRVYEAGHYTTASRAEMSAIFAELERRPPREC